MRGTAQKALFSVSFAGLLVALYLVYSDLRHPGYCPRLRAIPACYLVFCSFALVMFSAVASTPARSNALFYPGAALGLGLAVWFSTHLALGAGTCPRFMDMPLCYVSLATFAVLFLLKAFTATEGKARPKEEN